MGKLQFNRIFGFLFAALCFLQAAGIKAQTGDNSEIQNSFSAKLNLSSTVSGSGAYYFNRSEFRGGFDAWVNARVSGNLGSHVSYFADIGVALLYAKRDYLGVSTRNVDPDPDVYNLPGVANTVKTFSQPLGYFPYTYRSAWSGFVFPVTKLEADGPTGWVDDVSIGFNLLAEISGSAFNNILQWRIGRNEREAAGMVEGSSLVLNKHAQPFMGIDIIVNPLEWLSIYSVTGILEYFDSDGISESSITFQNAFTLSMLTLHYKDYVQVDVGTSSIWPKRFELGYLFPLMMPLLYQNNIGDFDNVAIFGNIKLQYPELGFLWASLFIDEMNLERQFFHLDREMYAYQMGLRYNVPALSFTTLTASYTKIEPYCYTHQKILVPWYTNPVQEAYTNHGYGLGYYLPPNSDEFKITLETMITPQTAVNVVFQKIRHGADYGDLVVDGSSYDSELGKDRGAKDSDKLKKNFLNDGAYQTQYVIKSGVKHSLSKFPMEFFFDGGLVFSFWSQGNDIFDTDMYPKRNGIILSAGARITY